jgi:hypothetical protein
VLVAWVQKELRICGRRHECAGGVDVALTDDLRSILRHARISREGVREFWDRVVALTEEFAQLPRSGDTVYGFAAGLYPTDHPTLPEAAHESTDR